MKYLLFRLEILKLFEIENSISFYFLEYLKNIKQQSSSIIYILFKSFALLYFTNFRIRRNDKREDVSKLKVTLHTLEPNSHLRKATDQLEQKKLNIDQKISWQWQMKQHIDCQYYIKLDVDPQRDDDEYRRRIKEWRFNGANLSKHKYACS